MCQTSKGAYTFVYGSGYRNFPLYTVNYIFSNSVVDIYVRFCS